MKRKKARASAEAKFWQEIAEKNCKSFKLLQQKRADVPRLLPQKVAEVAKVGTDAKCVLSNACKPTAKNAFSA
ncbi:hypothetical protein [Rufibacter ruber]|uniref:hypothetical protein n=1 Tax=Rufibacter ruber TaxID=1783499 RepID=UPI00082FAFB3|nr:hypothetical protein [Rufibacter ruber]